jgi:hypothetical protein
MSKLEGREQRQFGRRQTCLHGWISVQGRPRLPCIVRNISLGGALLELDRPSWLPFNFQLTIESTRYVTMCEVRHHSPRHVGVRFMTAVEHAALDRQRASDNRSLHDNDAWMGDAGGSTTPADRLSASGSAIARSLRERN